EVESWAKAVRSGQYDRAFYRTLDPAARKVTTPDNTGDLVSRFGERYALFRQIDIVRLAKRTPGATTFHPGAMREWLSKPGQIECMFTGMVKCPEGRFPVEIGLRASDNTGGGDG